MEPTDTMSDALAPIPAYARSSFVSGVYRASLLVSVVSVCAGAFAGVRASVSLALGAGLALASFWALERTLAVKYGGHHGQGRWLSFGLAIGKYVVVAGALLMATRVDGLRMGYVAAGLAVVYVGVVVSATLDMVRRNAAAKAPAGSGDVV